MSSFVPDLVTLGTLEEVISSCKETFEQLHPGILESESDYYMPVIEAQAEREFRLRVEINTNFRNQFWMLAEGEWLDFAAREFGVVRLEGSKPWAKIKLFVSEALSIDITIPAGMLLGGTQEMTAQTKLAATIPAGARSVEVIAELDAYISSSEEKLEEILTPLPYILEATQLESWHDGKAVESDERLRERIEVSLDTLSGAGPYRAYRKLTLKADSRIRDVLIYGEPGEVHLVIDTESYDEALQTRVMAAVNAEEVRPLTDHVILHHATAQYFDVAATLVVEDGIDANTVVQRAKDALRLRTEDIRVGESLSRARLIDALFVSGVRDIRLTSPADNLSATREQVLKLAALEVSYAD